MIAEIRNKFNTQFTEEKYKAFIEELHSQYFGALEFRVAETPIFVDKFFTKKMLDTCENIIDVITGYNFKTITSHAIPGNVRVPNEQDHCHFIAFDFGICENEAGELEPQLIEMQGFPTLFAYHAYYPQILEQFFQIPADFSNYFNNLNFENYIF